MAEKTFLTYARAELKSLDMAHQLRRVLPVDGGAARWIDVGGKRLLNLASNNYLGLSCHPDLTQAACDAAKRFGASSGASRLITGNFALYDELERQVAHFKGQEDALVLGSGYAANLAIFAALADRQTVVFSDRLNHASIVDGIRLSGAKHVRYRHADFDHLRHCLEKHRKAQRKILVTDTVFSMDGDSADLGHLVRLCSDHDVLLVVDEAHATGIFGQGRGLAHALDLASEVDLHMSTFSKAMGSYGGSIAGRRDLIDLVRNRGRAFIFSTALPPAVVGANLAALQWIRHNPGRGRSLLDLAASFRSHLNGLGFDTGASSSQIIPIILGTNEIALKARDIMAAHSVYVPAVRPPTVPEGTSRLRVSLRADLTEKDMQKARDAFAALAGELSV